MLLDVGKAIYKEFRVFFDTVAPAIGFDFGGIHTDVVGYFAI